jgi:hypothetical protein
MSNPMIHDEEQSAELDCKAMFMFAFAEDLLMSILLGTFCIAFLVLA